MAQSQHENYIRCHAALQAVLSKTLPCLQNALDLWHQQTEQRLHSCSTPNICPANKKPSRRNNSCMACINWAAAIEAEVYPTSKVGSLQWSNVNPTLFGKDPLEVIKLYALRLPPNLISTLGDFDPASLLMIMGKFKEFHHGNQAICDQVTKVSNIRNSLAHLKLNKNLNLDDQTFNSHWTDITDLVNGLQSLGRSYFTQHTAQDIHEQLTQIKDQTVSPQIQTEALRPLVEDVLLKTMEDSQQQQQGDPLDLKSCQKFLKGIYRSNRSGIGFLPGFPKDFPSDEFFVELDLAEKQKTPTEVNHVPLKTYTDLLRIQDKSGKGLDHVLVAGTAGTGKTTLVSRLAYQWAMSAEVEQTTTCEEFQRNHDKTIDSSSSDQLLEPNDNTYTSMTILARIWRLFSPVANSAYQWVKAKIYQTMSSAGSQTEQDQPTSSSNSEQLSDSEESSYFDAVGYSEEEENSEPDSLGCLDSEKDSEPSLSKLTTFQLVFALDIRKFKPDMDLVDAIKDQLLSHVSKQALNAYLVANADRCLFLVDGYDELSSDEKVLSSKELCSSYVILTTRPDKVDKINDKHSGYVHVSLNGFSEESVSKFIYKYFGNSETDRLLSSPEKLLELIRGSVAGRNLSQFPLLLAMMCLNYKDEKKLPETISSLFNSIIEYLVRHWKARKSDCDSISVEQFKTQMEFDDLMVKLGCTAFKGLQDHDSKLIFKDGDFESPEVVQSGCDLGLLSKSSSIRGFNRESEISFIHKTFQEYCAALYLSSLVESNPDMFHRLIKQIDVRDWANQYVVKFCCGSSEKAAGLILSCVPGLFSASTKRDCDANFQEEQCLLLAIILLYEVEMRFGFNQCLHDTLKPVVACFHIPQSMIIFDAVFRMAFLCQKG